MDFTLTKEQQDIIKAARNLYYEAAWSVDQGKIDPGLIAMAQWYSAEMAARCSDEALQMHGGYGYIEEYRIQRLYRDAKILEIHEGTRRWKKLLFRELFWGKEC